MSKSLRSYPKAARPRVVARRLMQTDKDKQGNGYWAARDYREKVSGDLSFDDISRERVDEMNTGSNIRHHKNRGDK